MKKKILFLTGTRADYGKLKILITATQLNKKFKPIILATGMHMQKHYGFTCNEIKKDFKNIELHTFSNQLKNSSMDLVLAKTIQCLNKLLKKIKPDLMIVHGDRVETLAASIYCNLHNVLIAHIEGGEVSGTVDESIRHACTKLSHIHLVANSTAQNVIQRLGELKRNTYVIGSPEVDTMIKKNLPSIEMVKKRYNIKFDKYGIFLFHPVTTLERKEVVSQCKKLFSAIIKSKKKFIIIYSNNDTYSEIIFTHIEKLRNNDNFRILPSLRFEYYLTLLKNSEFIIGNSSSGVREAPVYGVKSINLGNRQKNRILSNLVKDINFNEKIIIDELSRKKKGKSKNAFNFGKGDSAKLFIKILSSNKFWKTDRQKYFS